MRLVFLSVVSLGLMAGCTTKNDVAIQSAHATARAQECAAVGRIAEAGAASEAAVLMAARGCGGGPAPRTSADRAAGIIASVSPIAGALINGAVGLEVAKVAAGTQSENIAAGTARAQMDADVLTALGRDQVVTVRPDIVETTNTEVVTVRPEIVTTPAPVIVQTPSPEIVPVPSQPQICAPDIDGVLVCQ